MENKKVNYKEINETKEKVKKYKELKATIKYIDIKIEELDEDLGPLGQSGEEKTGKTYKITSLTENQALDIIEKKEDLFKERRALVRKVDKIDNALTALEEHEREIIEQAVIENKKYVVLQIKFNYTYGNIRYIETNALKKMIKYLN